jgi:hypothetical protein
MDASTEKLLYLAAAAGVPIPEHFKRTLEAYSDKALEAEEQFDNYLSDQFAKQAKQRAQAFEQMAQVRAKLRNDSIDGTFTSPPPPIQGKSRLACCEVCLQDFAILRDNLPGPVSWRHFQPLLPPSRVHPGFSVFRPGQAWADLKCPTCGKRPVGDPSMVLVSDGWKVLKPAPAEEAKAEESQEEPEAGFIAKGETVEN